MGGREIRFSVPGPPQGKARPRVVKNHSGKSIAYTPEKTKRYEELVKWSYKNAARGFSFNDWDYLKVDVLIYHKPPLSTTVKKRALMITGEIRPAKKPDADNIVKIILDALNGVAYKDDVQVVEHSAKKYYAEESCVVVSIKKIE